MTRPPRFLCAFLFALTLAPASVLEWQTRDGARLAPLTPAGPGRTGFTRMPALAAGVTFTNFVSDDRTITNRNLLSGSGVALGDVDGDGGCDVLFCGLDVPPQLYRNLGGWTFTNASAAAFTGLKFSLAGGSFDNTGATLADVDGDGDLDLLLNAFGGGTRLFLNDGQGHFTEATEAAGIRSRTGATSLALADVEGDGDLDLYVCNFRPTTILDQPTAKFALRNTGGRPVVISVNGRPTTEPDLTNRFELGPGGDVIEFAEPDVLWLNDGTGKFTATSWTDGTFLDEDGKALTAPPRDWGLAAHFADVEGDGRPDLYVCNDLHTPDRFWLNVSTGGRPQFRAIARTALRNNSTFSMGVDFGDLNRDGFLDFFTVDMLGHDRASRARSLAAMAPQFRPPGLYEDRVQVQRNALQLGRGDGTFAETAWFGGVEASDWSWGPIFLDVDLDGFEDILVTNGQLRDFQDSDGAERIATAQRAKALTPDDIARLVRTFPRLSTPNLLYRNRTGERLARTNAPRGSAVPLFAEVGREWGFATPGISQGAALADLDHDGDLDVVMNNLLDAPGFYRNDTAAPRVAVRLKGAGRNTHGIGARILVPGSAGMGSRLAPQSQAIIAGGRYLSGDEAIRTFAASGAAATTVEIRWPSGRTSLVTNVPANSLLEVTEPRTEPTPAATRSDFPARPPLFEDASSRLNHVHVEEPFDDFTRQPLLPNRLSQLGPGATWCDVNQDGRDDLVIGAGRSGTVAVFINDGQGGFKRLEEAPFNRPVGRDVTTILPFNGSVLVGSSNWEDGQTNGGAIRLYDLAGKRSGELVLGMNFSVGPLAAADVDGDGELEILVGGRAIPGRWPEPAPSLLLKNAGGRLTVAQRFEELGRFTGACFSDLDGDGQPDLLLAGEWGPLRVFRNQNGQLAEYDPPVDLGGRRLPLSQLSGLWNSLTAGDFDGDGRLDFIAGNWGLNSKYGGAGAGEPSSTPRPLRRMYFGDLNGTGTVDLVESLSDPGGEWPAREYPLWAMAYPWLRTEIPTYTAFAEAPLARVFGDRLKAARSLEINWLASTLFLNRGDHFEARPLPDQAQLAPVFGLAVADANGDGNEDVFLAQNWFETDPMTARNDAGRGLWLLGDGRGSFTAELLSGVTAYGEGRAAAVADYDGDGRPDLVVTQNAAPSRLFRNVGARPGLRVRLNGGGANPQAIGAVLRLVFAPGPGPWRELHLGAGYWSVDSAVAVLAKPSEPLALEVRWPGGKLTRSPLPAGAREVGVSPDGTVTAIP